LFNVTRRKISCIVTGTTNTVQVVYSKTATLGSLSVTARNASGCTSIARTLAITGLKSSTIPTSIQGATDQAPSLDVTSPTNELKVYPNPTKGHSTFEFKIDQKGNAKLDLYSIGGQLIDRIFDAEVEAGVKQTVLFDQTLPSGIYLCTLRWNEQMITVKLVVNK
jgi:Secretion system C-terminal sorting domain